MSFNVSQNLRTMRMLYQRSLDNCRLCPQYADSLQVVFSLRTAPHRGGKPDRAAIKLDTRNRTRPPAQWKPMHDMVQQQLKGVSMAIPMFIDIPDYHGPAYGWQHLQSGENWDEALTVAKGEVLRMTLAVGVYRKNDKGEHASMGTHVDYMLFKNRNDAIMFKLACL